MATVDFNSAIYYTISDGKICRQFKQPQEGAIERVTKTGKTVYEKFFKALKGRITDIQTRDTDFGKFWRVSLDDGSGTTEVLEFQYSSGYANGFLMALPNIDLGSDVVLSPNMKIEGDKKKTTLFISQHGTPIKWAYTKDHKNGLPELEQIKVKGKITWDDSSRMEFLESMVKNQILPQLKAKKYDVVAETVTAPEEDNADDLPF